MTDLIEHAPCGFLSFSDDGIVREVNTAMLRLLGVERQELLGQNIQGIFAPGSRIFYQTHFFPLLKMRGEVEEIYLSLRSRDGRELPVLVNARRNEREGLVLNDCILVRIHERARFEEELLKARNAAQKANKVKDDFFAALSHELRNPLNPVLMLSTAMEMDPELSEEVREQAGIIRRNAELEARLIDDLLDVTRIAHGKMKLVEEAVDLHVLLSQTEEIVKSEGSGKRVPIRFFKEAAEHYVVADAARIQQVFWNLVKNAIKFTPAGGEVRVVTSNDTPGRITVRVIDSGIGIEPEQLSRIFDAFDQGTVSTKQFGGLGLGLAITKAIVKMHKGVIRAESAGRGHGATFLMELATCAPPRPSVPLAAPGRASKLRLLLVEDHDTTREVLAQILRRAGHEVHAASCGSEALELAGSVGPLDVMISDLGLPDQSGFDLMRAIKARHGLPGIALSGYGMDEDVRKSKDAGFKAHLVKPVSLEQLRVNLQLIVEGKI